MLKRVPNIVEGLVDQLHHEVSCRMDQIYQGNDGLPPRVKTICYRSIKHHFCVVNLCLGKPEGVGETAFKLHSDLNNVRFELFE